MAEGKNPLDQALDVLFFAPVGLLLTARQELPSLAEKGRQRVTGQVALAKMVGRFAVVHGQREAEKATGRLIRQAADAVSQFGAVASPPSEDLLREATPSVPAAAPPRAEPVGSVRAASAVSAASSMSSPPTAGDGSAVPQGDFTVTRPGRETGTTHGGGEARSLPSNGRTGVSSNGQQTSAAAGALASAAAARPAPEAGTLAIPGYDALSASQVVQRLAGLAPGELDAVGRYESATRGRRTILSKVAQLQTEG